MDQIEIHKRIDEAVLASPQDFSQEEIKALILVNMDARQYFYDRATKEWLGWLWENGFLDGIKKKAETSKRYRYRTPELLYISRISATAPEEVVDIILDVSISEENFNPEVVDQFLRIASELPAPQLVRLVGKINGENWVQLMSVFNDWGFEYKKMLETLSESGDNESLLILSSAILGIKDKEAFDEDSSEYFKGNPFYFKDLSYSSVFNHLANINDDVLEGALKVACDAMSEIIKLGDKTDNGVFEYKDQFYLYDTDFFTLELQKETNNSDRENVKSLAATIKKLVQRVLKDCSDSERIMSMFTTYINALPSSSAMWRLKLYVISLCPDVFREEAEQRFSKLFDAMESGKGYYEIESGAEYKKSLKKCFGSFDSNYQRTYVENVFKHFTIELEKKKDEELHKRTGWEILSSISSYLSEDEKKRCKEEFGRECDSTYEPEPLIGKMRGGAVSPRGQVSQEEFSSLSVADIAQKLRSEWSPNELKPQNSFDDFLRPLNAEGVGSQLRSDISKRLQVYLSNSSLFFDRDVLDEHYTHSFIRGVQESIRENKGAAQKVNWAEFMVLLTTIVESGIKTPFDFSKRERERFGGWLASWEGVHDDIADIIQELLSENDGRPVLVDFSNYRDRFLAILDYLLQNPDPKPEDEELETAVSKTRLPGKQEEYLVSDPFSIAINSVRGRAYQALVQFIFQDGKSYQKDDDVKIGNDVKNLYERVLNKENTRAIMFMFGHYLPSFYFRDRKWMNDNLLAKIFPSDETKKHLYIAAWEGYLANNLYEEIFFEPAFQKLYDRGMSISADQDAGRRYFKEPDEGLAVHLALAFMVYNERFGFEDKLFQKFWHQDEERQSEFVSFIGRMFVTGKNQKVNELLNKEKEVRDRLVEFWEWTLQNCQDKKILLSFAYWMSLEKEVFDTSWLAEKIKQTLEKTNGALDWEYGLSQIIVRLAEAAPEQAVEIVRLYLLEGGVRGRELKMPFMRFDEWFDAVKVLYEKPQTKDASYKLINDLIAEGGNVFWKFKEIVG